MFHTKTSKCSILSHESTLKPSFKMYLKDIVVMLNNKEANMFILVYLIIYSLLHSFINFEALIWLILLVMP